MSKAIGGLFGGGGGQQVVSTSPQIPQYVQDFQKDIFSQAKQASSGLGVRQFAGFNDLQNQGFSQLNGLNSGFAGALPAAQQALAGQATNPFLGGAISQYMNPYTQEVIDTTMGDLNRQRQIAQQGVNAQAISRGAFGGSRQAVAEAENDRNFMDVQARTAAQLRSQGFDTALNAAQNDAARQQQAYSLMNNSFLGNLNAMLSGGAAQQGLAQDQLDAARNLPAEQLGLLTNAFSAGQLPYGTSQSTAGGTQGSNKLLGALGGAATGASLAGALGVSSGTAAGLGALAAFL